MPAQRSAGCGERAGAACSSSGAARLQGGDAGGRCTHGSDDSHRNAGCRPIAPPSGIIGVASLTLELAAGMLSRFEAMYLSIAPISAPSSAKLFGRAAPEALAEPLPKATTEELVGTSFPKAGTTFPKAGMTFPIFGVRRSPKVSFRGLAAFSVIDAAGGITGS